MNSILNPANYLIFVFEVVGREGRVEVFQTFSIALVAIGTMRLKQRKPFGYILLVFYGASALAREYQNHKETSQ